MQKLTINADRLWDSIHRTAEFGACPGGGIGRLTLTESDRHVRDWFRAEAERLDCSVVVDDVGNMFARRAGRRTDRNPIAIGSHFDTQPTGGRYDGVLGVLAGLEILRVLAEADAVTDAPIEIVNWTNEEGARFPPAMLASGVFAGTFTPEYARSRLDDGGISFGEALERIGYRGSKTARDHALAAYLELHIEQGPILEAEGLSIGVVTGVQGARWFDIKLIGGTGHTGATPMGMRRNALVGAARLVEGVDRIARTYAPEATATIGRLNVSPNSRNVIPGEVTLTVDLRHPDDGVLASMSADLTRLLTAVASELTLEQEAELVLDVAATRFNPELVDAVEAAAKRLQLKHRRLVSGAAHDSVHVAKVAPTTMIFVPSRGGISHNVAEFTTRDHCAAGTQVLLETLLVCDDRIK